jgi:hypothetical protein
MRDFRPPESAFRALCRQLPHIAFEDDLVKSSQYLESHSMLNRCERIIVSALRKHGGVLQRQELVHVCSRSGINPNTISQQLVYSPIITRLASNIYGVVGASLSPADKLPSGNGPIAVRARGSDPQ